MRATGPDRCSPASLATRRPTKPGAESTPMSSPAANLRRKTAQRPGDRIFSASALTAGSLILAILAAVAGFLVLEGIPGVTADPGTVSIFEEGVDFTGF